MSFDTQAAMFEVIFEVNPHASKWDAYLNIAKSLKPELEQIRGFIDNVRWKSLTRPGWLLSLSDWENEKALVRWRAVMKHHHAQEKGREEIFKDYHLRIGEVIEDSSGGADSEQMRFDETEIGEAKVVSLMTSKTDESVDGADVDAVLEYLGFEKSASYPGLVAWDVYEAILTPGKFLLGCSWVNRDDALAVFAKVYGSTIERTRQVRVVRDYGMFDREEAPQYYPEVDKSDNES